MESNKAKIVQLFSIRWSITGDWDFVFPTNLLTQYQYSRIVSVGVVLVTTGGYFLPLIFDA